MKDFKFQMGKIVYTQGIAGLLADEKVNNRELTDALISHGRGRWGEMYEEDYATNEEMLRNGGRLHSVHRLGKDCTRIWFITEADRSITTILLPEEY